MSWLFLVLPKKIGTVRGISALSNDFGAGRRVLATGERQSVVRGGVLNCADAGLVCGDKPDGIRDVAHSISWWRGKKKLKKSKKPQEEVMGDEDDDTEEVGYDSLKYQAKVDQKLKRLKVDLSKLRTSRPNPNMLDSVQVKVDGLTHPLMSVAHVTLKGSKMLEVNVFSADDVVNVKKAIESAGLNLNPSVDGTTVKIPIPKMSKETREQTLKQAHALREGAKSHINSVRQSAMKKLQQLKKSKELSEDEFFLMQKASEETFKKYVKNAESMVDKREKEIQE
mmetsp:Transcript_9058/g.17002  ORF Transcript_9058/g.17002 Transcript_9058/m.17002 type:complete len:282 (-) Transcript_9058:1644-2489(-)